MYAEPELHAVGFFLRIRRFARWRSKKQPRSKGKAGENSPHLLGSIRERESRKKQLESRKAKP